MDDVWPRAMSHRGWIWYGILVTWLPFCTITASQLNDVLVLVTAPQLWCLPQPLKIHWVIRSNHGQFKFCGQVLVPGPLPYWETMCPLMQASVEILLLSYSMCLVLSILPLQTCGLKFSLNTFSPITLIQACICASTRKPYKLHSFLEINILF